MGNGVLTAFPVRLCTVVCCAVKVTQALAAQWKLLDADARKKYEEKSDAAKAEMAALGGDDDDAPAASKKKRAPKSKGPKKPPTAQTLWQEKGTATPHS